MNEKILPSLLSSLYLNQMLYCETHTEFDNCCNLLAKCQNLARIKTNSFISKFQDAIYRANGPSPRFGTARTNFAKSIASTMIWCQFRYVTPYEMIPIICHLYNQQTMKLKRDHTLMRNHPLTTTGLRIQAAANRRRVCFNRDLTLSTDG
jgi:hypothetical protein